MRACSVSEQASHIPLDGLTFLRWLSRWWRGQHESGSPSFSITSRDRTTAAPALAPQPDTQEVPTWADERGAVLDALRSLCELCETLHERITEIQKRPWGAAYHAIKQWGDAECARIEQESKEPLELPSLRSLRQATDA